MLNGCRKYSMFATKGCAMSSHLHSLQVLRRAPRVLRSRSTLHARAMRQMWLPKRAHRCADRAQRMATFCKQRRSSYSCQVSAFCMLCAPVVGAHDA